jgi:quercetin dioxygenase-like cupin family protein
MKPTLIYGLVSALAISATLYAAGAQAHNGPHDGEETRTFLQTKQLADVPNTKGIMLTVTYAPGQASTPHRHPRSVFAYVLEGEVISKVDDGPEVTYKPGDSWYESPRAAHVVSRNASTTKPAKLLVWLMVGDNEKVAEPLDK